MPGSEFAHSHAIFPKDIQKIKAVSLQDYDDLCKQAMHDVADIIDRGNFDVIHDHMGLFFQSDQANRFQKHRKVLGVSGQLENPIL